MTHAPTSLPGWAQSDRQPRIAIIGAGMSGIAAVVKLRKAGYTDLTVFEKADRVGGTWRENRYPGLSCDIPAAWYSFSFAKNPNWTHRFAYGPEIQAYMEKTARDFDVLSVVRFNCAVTKLDYLGPNWRLQTATGEVEVFDVVVAATGVLHHPAIPNFKGLDDFQGQAFHTARWPEGLDLRGKRVGVIGTGSTSAQIVGAVTDQVAHLTLFQRTPQWMHPLPQVSYSRPWRWLLETFPSLNTARYWFWLLAIENLFAEATLGNKLFLRYIQWACDRHLRKQVKDPVLRGKLRPQYQAACKRLIFCSNFYPAISRDNASLCTSGIERIEAQGVRSADGQLHELDLLILATGFDVGKFVLPTKVTGENGRDLEEFWNGTPRAHRSVGVPGFPNFWMIEGPTGPVGNISLILVSEYQIDHLISVLNKMRAEALTEVAPREEAFVEYNATMAQAAQQTVWFTGGCDSWYLDQSGIPNIYPWRPRQFRSEMRHPRWEEYELRGQTSTPSGSATVARSTPTSA